MTTMERKGLEMELTFPQMPTFQQTNHDLVWFVQRMLKKKCVGFVGELEVFEKECIHESKE